MKVTLFSSWGFILLLASVSAELSFDAPEEVTLEENFSVRIASDIQEVGDVKIAIQNEEGKIFSQLYNKGAWKSSFYYFVGAYPEQSTYILRAIKEPGEYKICAKLRLSDSSIIAAPCSPIKVINSPASDTSDSPKPIASQEDGTQEEREDTKQEEKKENNFRNSPKVVIPKKGSSANNEVHQEIVESIIVDEPIHLSSPISTTAKEQVLLSSAQKKQLWLILLFTLCCCAVLIGMLRKQRQHKNI